MMMSAVDNNVIELNENVTNHLFEIISVMKEGDVRLVTSPSDFSENLISLMNEKFQNLPLKAKLLTEGDDGYMIKLVYPDSKSGGCCGSCS